MDPVEPEKIGLDDLHLVLDNCFLGLAKFLYNLGLDVIAIGKQVEHKELVKVCMRQNRVIVTCDSVYNHIHFQVPINMCVRIPTEGRVVDQAMYLFNLLGVHIPEDDH